MTPTFRLASGALAALLLAFAAHAQAQPPSDGNGPPDPQGQQGQRPHGPPPEAIAACKGKAVGTVASFTDRGGRTVSGPCTKMGDVVAVPPPQPASGAAGGPPPRQQ
jgi:hypothetical protein